MARSRVILLVLVALGLSVPSRGAAGAAPPAVGDTTAVSAVADSVPLRARMRVFGTPVAVLRAGPGTEHPIVATVEEHTILDIDARVGAWLHGSAGERSGWIHTQLLRNDVDTRPFRFHPDPGRIERQRTLSVNLFLGSYAADREDNGFLYGARLGYALTRHFLFEVSGGRTRIVRSTFVLEQVFNLRLEEETFDVFFYEVGLAMDLLPGRRVTPFVGAGVGATILNARVEPTWSLAVGTRAFLSRQVALRWEVRDHRLKAGNQFTRFTGDNLEFSAGTEWLF